MHVTKERGGDAEMVRNGESCGKGCRGLPPTRPGEDGWNVTFSLFVGDGIKLAQSRKCVINAKMLPGGKVASFQGGRSHPREQFGDGLGKGPAVKWSEGVAAATFPLRVP